MRACRAIREQTSQLEADARALDFLLKTGADSKAHPDADVRTLEFLLHPSGSASVENNAKEILPDDQKPLVAAPSQNPERLSGEILLRKRRVTQELLPAEPRAGRGKHRTSSIFAKGPSPSHVQKTIQRFAVATMSKGVKPNGLFRCLDVNRDRHLSMDELRRLMTHFQPELTHEEVVSIFEQFDLDGSGLVSAAEFHQCVLDAIVAVAGKEEWASWDATCAWENVEEALAWEGVCSKSIHTNVMSFDTFSSLCKTTAVC